MKFKYFVSAALASVAIAAVSPASAHGGDETVTEHFSEVIPNIPGKSLIALIVDYPPGGASVAHTHAQSAFIYAHVLSGEIESKVNDGESRIYKSGESWSEPPAASHPVSRNVSKTEPARLLALFIVDSAERELTTPVPHDVGEAR